MNQSTQTSKFLNFISLSTQHLWRFDPPAREDVCEKSRWLHVRSLVLRYFLWNESGPPRSGDMLNACFEQDDGTLCLIPPEAWSKWGPLQMLPDYKPNGEWIDTTLYRSPQPDGTIALEMHNGVEIGTFSPQGAFLDGKWRPLLMKSEDAVHIAEGFRDQSQRRFDALFEKSHWSTCVAIAWVKFRSVLEASRIVSSTIDFGLPPAPSPQDAAYPCFETNPERELTRRVQEGRLELIADGDIQEKTFLIGRDWNELPELQFNATDLLNCFPPVQSQLLPGAPYIPEDQWISAMDAVSLVATAQGLTKLGFGRSSVTRAICRRAFNGALSSRCVTMRVEGKKDSNVSQNVRVPANFWWRCGDNMLLEDWRAGDFECGSDAPASGPYFVTTLSGVQFVRREIMREFPRQELSEDVPLTNRPTAKGTGRPPDGRWEEVISATWAAIYANELNGTPITQAAIARYISGLVSDWDVAPGETSIKSRARMIKHDFDKKS